MLLLLNFFLSYYYSHIFRFTHLSFFSNVSKKNLDKNLLNHLTFAVLAIVLHDLFLFLLYSFFYGALREQSRKVRINILLFIHLIISFLQQFSSTIYLSLFLSILFFF